MKMKTNCPGLAAALQEHSDHPLGDRREGTHFGSELRQSMLCKFVMSRRLQGRGVAANLVVENQQAACELYLGNLALMQSIAVPPPQLQDLKQK